MASKKKILSKIRILITQGFSTPEEAFSFFDKDDDGFLSKKELKKLVKKAKVNRLISGMVASKMIDGLDKDKNKKFDWTEFKLAVEDLIAEGLKEEKKQEK